jgi:hypothetical protein
MKGYIYIASSFETVNRSMCGQRGSWVDNDPHFWTEPPTWGICRNDLRATAEPGDVVLFALPKGGRHPQTIFGYLTIARIVTHLQAYQTPALRSKRMGNKQPNGNIIVNARGNYNRFDEGAHFYKWQRIAQHYAIGRPGKSKLLSATEIKQKAPLFLSTLTQVLGKSGPRPIDVISRKGAMLTELQVERLLAWLRAQ